MASSFFSKKVENFEKVDPKKLLFRLKNLTFRTTQKNNSKLKLKREGRLELVNRQLQISKNCFFAI